MKLSRVALVCSVVMSAALPALAQPYGGPPGPPPAPRMQPPPPPPPAAVWDSRGWVMLGEREVNGRGRVDRDSIAVGRQEGRFSKLTLVVENSDMELVGFTVNFVRGQPWMPQVSHYFREGQRTRVLEIPPNTWGNDARSIQSIDFAYRNIPGGGRAKIAVFGWREAPVQAPAAPVFNSSGWSMLGENEVRGHGRTNNVRLDVGRELGKFSQLTIVVTDADLELIDMSVGFRRGEPWHPGVKHFFREGQRSRVIDLPVSEWGNGSRTIQFIDLSYRNLPGEGHARIQVWAR